MPVKKQDSLVFFFECIDNQGMAPNLLFKIAGDWLNERGCEVIYGPPR